MSLSRWIGAAAVAAAVSGCVDAIFRPEPGGEVRRMVEAAGAIGTTAPAPQGVVGAHERLWQAEAAMQANDDARAWYLLEQAEADAWSGGARDRSRVLLLIQARQAELLQKKKSATAEAKVDIPVSGAPAAPAPTPPAQPAPPPTVPAQAVRPADQPVTHPAPTIASWVALLGDGSFDSGSAVLRTTALTALDRLAQILRTNPERVVSIEGFTDSLGGNRSNQILSRRRAEAVQRALADRGIALSRMTVRGYGAAFPVASNATADGRQRNRRVEVIVSDTAGRIPARR